MPFIEPAEGKAWFPRSAFNFASEHVSLELASSFEHFKQMANSLLKRTQYFT